jgi:hypothetical protein
MWSFLSSLLAALPIAAKSNAALTAFAIAAVAYTATMWRVSRNNIQKLSLEDRLAALEIEMGGVRLSSGVSPEQWIRSRIHRYYFFAFTVTVVLITVFTSLLFIYRDGRADISVELKQSLKELPFGARLPRLITPSAYAKDVFSGDTDDDRSVHYSYAKQARTITISPELRYLDAQRRGEPVPGFSWWHDPFKWDFPSLAVKVVNNTRHDLVLSEIVFRVRKSSLDVRPAFAVKGPSYDGRVKIVNEGWGSITDPSVKVAIKSVDSCHDFKLDDPHSIPLGKSDGNSEGVDEDGDVGFSIASLVPAALIGKTLIGKTKRCTSRNLKIFMRECSDTPICVQGQLNYVDQNGTHGILRFSTVSFLGNPMPGAPMPPSFIYDAFLEAGKSDYTQRLSISQQIRPGEADNFSLRIATDRSAEILAVDGSVAWTGSFSLSIFVPKSGAERGQQSFQFVKSGGPGPGLSFPPLELLAPEP